MAIREMVPDSYRVEEDALGEVRVPAEHLWGAQTQRSHMNFPIGVERIRWGRPVIRALGVTQSLGRKMRRCRIGFTFFLAHAPRGARADQIRILHRDT